MNNKKWKEWLEKQKEKLQMPIGEILLHREEILANLKQYETDAKRHRKDVDAENVLFMVSFLSQKIPGKFLGADQIAGFLKIEIFRVVTLIPVARKMAVKRLGVTFHNQRAIGYRISTSETALYEIEKGIGRVFGHESTSLVTALKAIKEDELTPTRRKIFQINKRALHEIDEIVKDRKREILMLDASYDVVINQAKQDSQTPFQEE